MLVANCKTGPHFELFILDMVQRHLTVLALCLLKLSSAFEPCLKAQPGFLNSPPLPKMRRSQTETVLYTVSLLSAFVPCHHLLSSPFSALEGGEEIEEKTAAKREQQRELVARQCHEEVLQAWRRSYEEILHLKETTVVLVASSLRRENQFF
jgi:hypothetical protein